MTRLAAAKSGPIALATRLVDESADPVAVDAVMTQLDEAGFDIAVDDLIDALVDEGGIWWINDQLLRPRHLLTHVSFGHALTAAEIAGNYVERTPDLHLLMLDEADAFSTNAGQLVHELDDEIDRLIGPPGWLGGHAAGDVIRFRWIGDGRLLIEPDQSTGDGLKEVGALRAAMERLRDKDDVADLLGVIASVCEREYKAFDNSPPLSELLARAGLCVEGDQVADTGFDWLAMWQARRSRYAEDLAEEHDLDHDKAEQLAMLRLSSLWDNPLERDIDLPACASALRDHEIADVFVNGFSSRWPSVVRNTGLFAEAVVSVDEGCAGAHLLLARVAEANGDALAHAAAVNRALASDAEFWPAFEDRAWVKADSGDARGAVRDLERYDEQHDRLDHLDAYAEPGPATAGRNDECPCGSGLKNKVCCGPRNGFPLPLRAIWLYEKALWFVARPAQRDEMAELIAEVLGETLDGISPRDPIVDLLSSDAVVGEAALFTRGLVERFRDERRLLLPADEAELLDSWLEVSAGLFRIERFDEDDCSLYLTDLVDGESRRVFMPGHVDSFPPGNVIASYLVPDGVAKTVVAWTPIHDADVEDIRMGLAAGDPLALPRIQMARRLKVR